MMAYSLIQKSQLEGAHRLDAEYYQPEYLEVKEKLSGLVNVAFLKEIGSISSGPAYSSEQISEEYEIPLARIGDVTNKFEVADWIKLSKNEFIKFNNRKINNLDILITMTGDPPDVGKCNIIEVGKDRRFAFNQRVAKITAKKVSPYYLFAYLSTGTARLQSERAALGIRQRNVGISDLRTIQVFLAATSEQAVIDKLIISYLSELNNSKMLYQKAEDLLLEELGLKEHKIKGEIASVVKLSEVEEAGRVDAEYFQAKYEILIAKIKEYGAKPLLEIITNVPATFIPAANPDKLFQYVELSDINASIGAIEGCSEVIGKEAPSRAKRLLKAGDVIVSSVEGSLGKVALVDKQQQGYLASTGFFQFRSQEVLSEVLLVMAKSIVFQMQLEKQTAGTILTAVPKDAIKNVFVPMLPERIQQKISDLVKRSHEARKKAKELLEDAKKKVEEMIEKGTS